MSHNTIKTIITFGIIIILFVIAVKLLKWLLSILIPLAIVVIAAYIVYSIIKKRR